MISQIILSILAKILDNKVVSFMTLYSLDCKCKKDKNSNSNSTKVLFLNKIYNELQNILTDIHVHDQN